MDYVFLINLIFLLSLRTNSGLEFKNGNFICFYIFKVYLFKNLCTKGFEDITNYCN